MAKICVRGARDSDKEEKKILNIMDRQITRIEIEKLSFTFSPIVSFFLLFKAATSSQKILTLAATQTFTY